MERWPPIYDAEDLANTIRELTQSNQLSKQFYDSSPRDRVCQGDIIQLPAPIPLLHEDGQPVLFDDAIYWMIIGNTCDIDREIDSVTWSQLVPLVDITEQVVTEEDLTSLTRYRYSRRFYVPPWSDEVSDRHYIADFLRPVAIHKNALFNVANIEIKLSYHGWILLHSCLVRFLARDDGRFD